MQNMPSDEADDMKKKIKGHIVDAAVKNNGVITKSTTIEKIATEREED
jgi:hypothetical protein